MTWRLIRTRLGACLLVAAMFFTPTALAGADIDSDGGSVAVSLEASTPESGELKPLIVEEPSIPVIEAPSSVIDDDSVSPSVPDDPEASVVEEPVSPTVEDPAHPITEVPMTALGDTPESGLPVDASTVGMMVIDTPEDFVAASIDAADVCAIEGVGFASLDAAINAAVSGQTITMLKSVTHTSPIVITGKNLTFDLTEGSITIDTSSVVNSYALEVSNAIITLTGAGYLDVKGEIRGVYAKNATVTVRYASALWGTGAYGTGTNITVNDDAIAKGQAARGADAMQGGHITAKNVIGEALHSRGAEASTGGSVTVTQHATGVEYGVNAYTDGVITVGGNAVATGVGGIGAWAQTGGKVTIDGEVLGETEYYVKINTVNKRSTEFIPVTTKPGYRTFTDGTSTVWVEGEPVVENVCAIGDVEYPTINDALKDVTGTAEDPTVIRLLTSINHVGTLRIGGLNVVFDLAGFNLNVDGDSNGGLEVHSGSVGYTGSGAFVVRGNEYSLAVTDGGIATVTGILVPTDYTIGAYAGGDGSRIVVNGDIRTVSPSGRRSGALAVGDNASIVFNGTVYLEGSNTVGVSAGSGGKIRVHVDSGEAISVHGELSCGIDSWYGGEVVVGSGLVSVNGIDSTAVYSSGGTVQVRGISVSGIYAFAVTVYDFGDVTVLGDIDVNGSNSAGINAMVGEGAGGTVYVRGIITVDGADSLGVVAHSRSNNIGFKSSVVIDGTLLATGLKLQVDGDPRELDEYDWIDALGYWVFHGEYGSTISIRNESPADVPVTPPTPTFLQECVDGEHVWFWDSENVRGMTWAFSEDGLIISAIPAEGFVIAEGAQSEWTGVPTIGFCEPKPTVPPTTPEPTDPPTSPEPTGSTTPTTPSSMTPTDGLPQSGDTGALGITVVGLVLLIGGAVLLVANRRRYLLDT